MAANLLSVMLGVFFFLTAMSWTFRETYIQAFRTADVNIFTHALLANSSDTRKYRQTHRDIAREWFRVSKDYRRFSIRLSYVTTWLLLSTTLMSFALITAFLKRFYVCSAFTIAGMIFLTLGVLVLIPHFRYIKPIPLIECFSDYICDRIPLLDVSPLRRWKEIEDLIRKNDWLNKS